VVLMAVDPLEAVLRLVDDGVLSAEEAAPILAALDDQAARIADDPGSQAGRRSTPPGGFGTNPPPGSATGEAPRTEAGDGARSLRIEVTDDGRRVVNLRLPIAVGKLALDRIPGLPADQVTRVREALRTGYRGSILEVDDDGNGVRIVLE
jgi:hypothetical protein